jgi:uncharacterized membrane protein SirB2
MTALIGGVILELKFRRAHDIPTKALILKLVRPIGLLSPVAMFVMLASGIGNMTTRGIDVFSHGWLTAKIIFFALLVISGVLFVVHSRKRSMLLQQAASASPEQTESAPRGLVNANRQISLFYCVISVLLLVILYLSIWKP